MPTEASARSVWTMRSTKGRGGSSAYRRLRYSASQRAAVRSLSLIELPAAVLSDDREVELRLSLVAQRHAAALAAAGERESEVGETIIAEHPRQARLRLGEILRPIALRVIVTDAPGVGILERCHVGHLCGFEDGQQRRGLRRSDVLRRHGCGERDEQRRQGPPPPQMPNR